MAVPRGSPLILLGGTLLFGALLFLLGLLVGISLSSPGSTPAVGGNPPALPAPASSPASTAAPAPASSPTPGGGSGGAAPVPAAPAADAPPAPVKTGGAAPEAAPAVKPLKVKGFGYGVPPSSPPASVLRGPLLEQAGAALPGTGAAPNADPVAQPAAHPAPLTGAPPMPAAKDPPGEPLVFSVAVGRFLLEDNAARRSAEARAKGFQPVVVVADPPDASGWLTVTLGPRGDAVAAGRLAEDAAAQGFDTRLVSWLAP